MEMFKWRFWKALANCSGK